jgi:hypothetical protein
MKNGRPAFAVGRFLRSSVLIGVSCVPNVESFMRQAFVFWLLGLWTPSTEARITSFPKLLRIKASSSAKVVFPAPSTPSIATLRTSLVGS